MSAAIWLVALLGMSAVETLAVQCDAHVLVAYYSETGHTRALAEAVAAGAEGAAGVRVTLGHVDSLPIDSVRTADAVIVGSPVHNANVAPAVQAFINRWPFDGTMHDKIGAAFASGGGISAGEETTQLAILRSMLIFGMVVVGGPEWTGAFGASAVTLEPPFEAGDPGAIAPQFLAKGRALGRRVAALACRFARGAGNP